MTKTFVPGPMPVLQFAKVRNVKTPTRGTDKAAGIDFYIPEDLGTVLVVPAHSDILIPSGIVAKCPYHCMLMGADKSGVVTSGRAKRMAGMNDKNSFCGCLIVGAKIVDEDYQGEIHIHLINTSDHEIVLTPGRKIAQFIAVPVIYPQLEEVPIDELFENNTDRGNGGFGHTGSY